MKAFHINKLPFIHSALVLVAVVSMIFHTYPASADDVPEGFRRMPDGSLTAVSGSNTTLPSNYQLTEDGEVRKVDEAPASGDSSMMASSEITEVPPGFHRMPNGDIMANNPSKAKAPPGYRLTAGGILVKTEEGAPESETTAASEISDVPPGFHRMPNGDIMANNPSTAVAPEGYHLMPNGVLMPNSPESSNASKAHEHHHGGGMWMVDYLYQRMYMDGMLDGTREVSAEEAVLPEDDGGEYGFMMAPTNMTMDMHMLMLMYHARDYMFMVMAHYMFNEMEMLSFDGTKSTMKTSGFGDTKLTAQIRGPVKLFFDVGLSVPTGSIDERGPMTHFKDFTQENAKYPYGMQLGSGTWDIIQGITYKNSTQKLGWGAKYEYTGRIHKNENDYKLGDLLKLEGWFTLNHTSTMGTTFKLNYRTQGQIEGADPELDPEMSPTMDPLNYGGNRLDLGVKFKYENRRMASVNAELLVPVYQDLYGPQMKTEWILGLGFGFMF